MDRVIVLDTNVLFSDPTFSQGEVGRLLALARSGRVDLVVSEVVLAELKRHHRRTVAGRLHQLTQAEGKVRESLRVVGLDPAKYPVVLPDVGAVDVDDAVDALFKRVRERLAQSRVEFMPLPKVSHAELLDRDLSGTPPFDASGRGYRDALIWHSILEWCRRRPHGALIYLLTSDGDFDQDALNRELSGVTSKHHLMTVPSIADLFSRPEVAELLTQTHGELEASAMSAADEAALDERIGADWQTDLHEAVSVAVQSAVASLGSGDIAYGVRTELRLPRAFGELDLIHARARGEVDWVLYELLDGETMLGQASVSGTADLSAEVHQDDAAVLADSASIEVERWEGWTAFVTLAVDVLFTFDLHIDVPGASVAGVTLSAILALD